MKTHKPTYTVYWTNGRITHKHDTFDTPEEAMQSIRDWWKKNDYTPRYIRQWMKGETIHIDYGSHSMFYEIRKN